MDEQLNKLKDIQDDRKKTLYRLNKMVSESPHCTCKSQLEHSRKEIHELRMRVRTLEQGNPELEADIEHINSDIKSLNNEIERIQRTLQSDDVKPKTNPKTKHETDNVYPVGSKLVEGGTSWAGASSDVRYVTRKNSNEESVFCNNLDGDSDSSLSSTVEYGENDPSHLAGAIGLNPTSNINIDSKFERSDAKATSSDLLEATSQMKVEVIKQKEKRQYDGNSFWRDLAQTELDISRTVYYYFGGVHTILCVDISESMLENNGWQQITTFVTDYLQGLEEVSRTYDITVEHVAMVTFGHETAVKLRYTNNFSLLLGEFRKLKVGGPSSLYGGLLQCLAAAWCSLYQRADCISGTIIPTKIIVLTDGRPSDMNIIAGPDTISDSQETKSRILHELNPYNRENIDFFFIPVGNINMYFIDSMVDKADGHKCDYKSGKRLSRRTLLSFVGGSNEISAEDREDLASIAAKTKKIQDEKSLDSLLGRNEYFVRLRSQLLPIGSRVRRGPDWKWGDHDKSGPGTVTGHLKDEDKIWVQWDADNRRRLYSYGDTGFDVLLTDEPRLLKKDRILVVGCNVKPGTNWDKSRPKHKRGVVINCDYTFEKVTVRWDTGHRGVYNADVMAKELEYCPNIDRFSEDSLQQSPRNSAKKDLHIFHEN